MDGRTEDSPLLVVKQEEEEDEPVVVVVVTTIELSPDRWRVLGAFSLLTCMNSWMWITWSPIAPALTSYWNVPSSSYVNELSTVYMYVYIPLSFPALYGLHHYRFRIGVTVGAILNFLGSILRYVGLQHFGWVYTGTVLCAIAQTLTLAIPPLLSGLWFGSHERGLATSLGVLANQLGTALGLGCTIFIHLTFPTTGILREDYLKHYIGLQMILSGLSLILVLVWIPSDKPPSPPSEAAATATTPSYLASIQVYFASFTGLFLFIIYGLVVGIFYAIATFLTEWVVPPLQEEEAGYLGLGFVLVGLGGSFVAGELLDRTSYWKTISLVFLIGSSMGMVLFGHWFENKEEEWKNHCLYGITGVLGFFLTGFMSIGFEYGTAISYPADEAAIAGILNVAAQIGGWILIDWHTLPNQMFVLLFLSTLIFYFGITAKSQRPV